jgi:hypothetical protein
MPTPTPLPREGCGRCFRGRSTAFTTDEKSAIWVQLMSILPISVKRGTHLDARRASLRAARIAHV